jgi:hypothetical protein
MGRRSPWQRQTAVLDAQYRATTGIPATKLRRDQRRLKVVRMTQQSQKPLGWIAPLDVDLVRDCIEGSTTAIMRERSGRKTVALYLDPPTATSTAETNLQLIETLKEVRDTLTRLAWDENHSLLEKINAALAASATD